MHSSQSKKQQSIFLYLLLLTTFYILLELSFFIQCNKAYLSDFTFVSGQLSIPYSIIPDIGYFLASQLVVHFGFCLLVWFTAVYSAYLFNIKSYFNFGIALWFIGIATILAANQYFFPNSKFTELTSIFLVNREFTLVILIPLAVICVCAITAAVIGFFVCMTKKSFNYTLFFMLILALASWAVISGLSPHPKSSIMNKYPNVILIGIDSLRPDFLGYFGAEGPTPFLNSVLQQSTVFTEAVTPLARTFPSWSAILLGEHPRSSGIRFNLADISNIDLTAAMPAIFRKSGYETIYATDETRFSNIDQKFGFNEVITPPIGLNDFLLGTFNDFPISNLIINSALGKVLFPYSYANRPAYVTYNPNSFIEMLRSRLLRSHDKPVFLSVHFCLPHYPYLWAGLNGYQFTPRERYRESIFRVDSQIKSFFALLQASGLLNHAIVVLLSDHGEALEISGDRVTQQEMFLGKLNKAGEPPRFYPPSLDDEAINQSAGHGTDVLGLTQYHTLLAVKLFGMGHQKTGDINGVVSLTDLKPALLAMTGISREPSLIAAKVNGKNETIPLRHIFIESDYSPEAIRTVYPETRKVLLEGIQLFQINPATTRLTVKEKMGAMIIRSKQFADIYGAWMLALYPQADNSYTSILVNLENGQWTNDLQSKFAKDSPAEQMLSALEKFYGNDLNIDIKDIPKITS
ncbi:MAG TPA: sulfatase-like hydrolase/transferase [Gammaproteobacteria bacterium]|jgi:hypothetical protein|nr:sulfatase-like hydrolase/transferase [Gammaproteobacteria bacterium]